MTSVLITGGTGFLGRVLRDRARDAGLTPFVFSPDADPSEDGIPGDVLKASDLRGALDRVRPTAVIHLAAFGIGGLGLIRSANVNPVDAARVNLVGFVSVFHAAAAHGVNRFVWSSSTSVFGSTAVHGEEPLDESVHPQPDTVYGATKRACELVIGPLAALGGPLAVGLRLPIVYGAGRYPGALGEFTEFARDVALGRAASFTASDAAYDWIHAVDAADALLLAARGYPQRTIYNVVGHRSTLADVARAIARHATATVEVTVEQRAGPVPALMDGNAFATEMSFIPRFDLARGAERYVSDERTQG